jgi:hypothetical protein
VLDVTLWKPKHASIKANPHVPIRNSGHEAGCARRNVGERFKCRFQPDLFAYFERCTPIGHSSCPCLSR